MSVATHLILYLRRLTPHSTLACPKHHASSSHQEIHCIPRWQTASVMDVHVVFHVQYEVLLASWIDLHLYGICDTVQANRDIWHTSQQRDKRVGFQFPLVITALAPPYTNCSVLSCHVHQLRGVTRSASKDRPPMRWCHCKRQVSSRKEIVSQCHRHSFMTRLLRDCYPEQHRYAR